MDELLDMIGADESASQISDKIKDMLFAKSAERVDAYRPTVASSLFGDQEEVEDESDIEIEAESDLEVEDPQEEESEE